MGNTCGMHEKCMNMHWKVHENTTKVHGKCMWNARKVHEHAWELYENALKMH